MSIESAEELLAEVKRVRDEVAAQSAEIREGWEPKLHRDAFRPSAENLADYLAFRRIDLRPVDAALAPWGLASLGRSESRVMPSLRAIIANLELICRTNAETPRPDPADFQQGLENLKRNTQAILGPGSKGRRTRILVTLSPRAAEDKAHVRELVDAGMDCARINCAHETPQDWAAMVANVRSAGRKRARDVRVLVDLAGPKVRTEDVVTPKKRKRVEPGDKILLTFGAPVGNKEFAYQASCTAPDVLRQVPVGAEVSIKDGLIHGAIEDVREEGLVMAVSRTPPRGQSLKAEKGINFPGTPLIVSPLTDDDKDALDFVVEHADIVSYSFVQRPEDIALLQSELARRSPERAKMPLVAKIETQLAFTNLPDLIVQAAGNNPFAVMIARGDLAVEIGYERLSEVQEEILWLCEAAHVPVIWATQVLESLVKQGMPSRGEFTDAAMAERAECVMLNKGPYIAEGIRVLDNVLRRMEGHRLKRSAQLRPLKAWDAVG
jgi:pyruvate kinase